MTIHVLHGGGGYTYLTRQVAAHDDQLGRGEQLSDYYTAHGHPPGRWTGRGTEALNVSGEVTEAQMRALFGEGRHPNTDALTAQLLGEGATPQQVDKATRLGRKPPAYAVADTLHADLAEAYRQFNVDAGRPAGAPLSDDEKAGVRRHVIVQAFVKEHGREPSEVELRRYSGEAPARNRDSVAGYDLVFTPVKSVAVLWGTGSDEVRREVWAAHNAAVRDTLEWVGKHAIYTRTGAGGVAQVDTAGMVAGEFVHFDSRAGDPDLHTHVAIANKVKGPDGKWRSIDGRALFPAAVAASERYNTRVEDELRRRLGVRFASRGGQVAGKREIREVVGVPPELIRTFSKRRQGIEALYDAAVADHVRRYGRAPDAQARWRLYQTATLTQRPDKDGHRSLREMVTAWRQEASDTIGADRLARLEAECLGRGQQPTRLPGLPEAAAELVERVASTRSTWTEHNVRAEAERMTRAWILAPGQRDQVVDDLVRAATAPERSVSLSAPADVVDPVLLRRADGASVFEQAGTRRWTTQSILDAEERIVASGRRESGHHLDAAVVNRRIVQTQLTAGQQDLVRAFTCATEQTVLALAAAGTGKTTAVKTAAELWAGSGRQVIALAPTAAAADVLGSELGLPADTIHAQLIADREIPAGAMIVVDEAGMVPTKLLDELITRADAADAVVRLLGDDRQLAAVEGGGAVRLFAHDVGAVQLDQVMRFRDPQEAAASLQLRRGDTTALGWYDHAGRIHGGEREEVAQAAYQAWLGDLRAGRQTLLLASDNSTVADLNARARADRVLAGEVSVDGIDARGTRIGVGDHVATRRNERTLVVNGGRDWVKNGDGWVLKTIAEDHLVLVHRSHGGTVQVGREWARDHVELDYARTVHRAQGLTVDRAHLIVDAQLTRSALYVGASRGKESNQLWVATHVQPEPGHVPEPEATAVEVLEDVVRHSDLEDSATQHLRDELDRSGSLGRLITHYDHAAAVVADARYRDAATTAGLEPLTRADSWPLVVEELRRGERVGWQPQRLLNRHGDDLPTGTVEQAAGVLAERIRQQRQDHEPPPPIAAPSRGDVVRYAQLAGINPEPASLERLRPVWLTMKAAETAGVRLEPLAAVVREHSSEEPAALGRRVHRRLQVQVARSEAESLVPPWLARLHRYAAPGPERSSLDQRLQGIERRVGELVDVTRTSRPRWAQPLLAAAADQVTLGRAIAYRHQYRVTSDDPAAPLGPRPSSRGRQQRAWDHTNARIVDTHSRPQQPATVPTVPAAPTVTPQVEVDRRPSGPRLT